MSLSRLLTAAAFGALLAGPAFAGPEPVQKPTPPPTQTPDDQTATDAAPAVAADQNATPASAMAVDPAAPAVILQSSPTPVEQAWTLKAGDPNVVSNGPVPDTAENRAKYGGPMSNGGRRTRPAGN